MSTLKISELLGQKHVIDVIVFLYFFGERNRSEIYHSISSSQKMPRKLEQMESAGIITTDEFGGHGRKATSLTEKGRFLAEALLTIEESMKGTAEEFRQQMADSITSNLKDMYRRVRIARRTCCRSRGCPCPRTWAGCPGGPA